MTVLTEGQHAGEFILSEANGNRSRENVTVTVPANTTLEAGSVLGKITASGKYVLYDEAAVDGSQTAAGVLYSALVNDTAGAVDNDGVIIARDAEVRSDDLQWKAGVDEAGGIVDLAGADILARD